MRARLLEFESEDANLAAVLLITVCCSVATSSVQAAFQSHFVGL